MASVVSLPQPPESRPTACWDWSRVGSTRTRGMGFLELGLRAPAAAACPDAPRALPPSLPLQRQTRWFLRTESLKHVRPSNLKEDLAAVAFLATEAVGLFFKLSG